MTTFNVWNMYILNHYDKILNFINTKTLDEIYKRYGYFNSRIDDNHLAQLFNRYNCAEGLDDKTFREYLCKIIYIRYSLEKYHKFSITPISRMTGLSYGSVYHYMLGKPTVSDTHDMFIRKMEDYIDKLKTDEKPFYNEGLYK